MSKWLDNQRQGLNKLAVEKTTGNHSTNFRKNVNINADIRRDDVMKVIKSLWINTSSGKGRHARSIPPERLPATVRKKNKMK